MAKAVADLHVPTPTMDMGWQGQYVHAYIVVHSAQTLAGAGAALLPPMSLLFPDGAGVGTPRVSASKIRGAKATMKQLQQERFGGCIPEPSHPDMQLGIQQWVAAAVTQQRGQLDTAVRKVQYVDQLVQRCQRRCDKKKVLRIKAGLLQKVVARLRCLHEAADWALRLQRQQLVTAYEARLQQMLQACSELTREQVAAGLQVAAELRMAEAAAAAAAPDEAAAAAAAPVVAPAAGGGAVGVAAMKLHMLQQRQARLGEELLLIPAEQAQVRVRYMQRVQDLENQLMAGASMEGVSSIDSSMYLLGQELQRAKLLLKLAEKHYTCTSQLAAAGSPDAAGVLPADVVLEMAGVTSQAEEGTSAD